MVRCARFHVFRCHVLLQTNATFHLKARSCVAVRMRGARFKHDGCSSVSFLRQYYANGRICFNFLAKKKTRLNAKIKAQCLATGMFEGIITMKVINVDLFVCLGRKLVN